MTITSKVADRLSSGLKHFQPILSAAKARDVNEHDTVVIAIDVLAELFGFDKYTEVTREYCVRGTFCDLAIKLDGKCQFLIEVKAIGLDLKDSHIKQVVDYAANEGIEWVAVTNGFLWRVFRVSFAKPIDRELVLDLDLLAVNPRNRDDLESLGLLTRESMLKSALEGYHDQQQATNRFFIAAVVTSEPVLEIVRRQLRRVSPDIKIDLEEIRERLEQDVLKRDVLEGGEAEKAKRKVSRSSSVSLRVKKNEVDQPAKEDVTPTPAVVKSGLDQ
jgi:hypothetical protein